MKTIYYYQTFVGLDKLFTHVQDVDVIIISSIHLILSELLIRNYILGIKYILKLMEKELRLII